MKAKRTIITIAFALLMLGLKAQDKFEYASVAQNAITPQKGSIIICTEGKYEETEIKITDGNAFKNLTPTIAVVNKMSKEGWEVYNTTGTGTFVYYFLRRKK